MHTCAMPARRRAARIIGTRGTAGATITAIAIAAAISGCGTRGVDAGHAPNHHIQELVQPARHPKAVSGHLHTQDAAGFQTTRTFRLTAGRATRTFTFREPSGVILINQLTVRHGVRALVYARIPSVAAVQVLSWPAKNNPSASCRANGSFEVCTQGEEWCPMPEAIWHFRLVKVSGPEGPIRFHLVVAARPRNP